MSFTLVSSCATAAWSYGMVAAWQTVKVDRRERDAVVLVYFDQSGKFLTSDRERVARVDLPCWCALYAVWQLATAQEATPKTGCSDETAEIGRVLKTLCVGSPTCCNYVKPTCGSSCIGHQSTSTESRSCAAWRGGCELAQWIVGELCDANGSPESA